MNSSENGIPLWLEAIRRLERTIGVPVERFVTSDAYFDLLPQLRSAQAQFEELAASATEHWYRLLNLPTGSDVRQLREQLSRMERQVEKLTKQLADREAPAAPKPRKPAAKS
jgi:hypothetical protein